MAIQVQWATGFEELANYTALPGTDTAKTKNMLIGWDFEWDNENGPSPAASWTQSDSGPHLRGWYAHSGLAKDQGDMFPRHFRPARPSDKMVLGFAYCLKGGQANDSNNRFAVGFRGGADYIHFRPVKVGDEWFAGLYVNDVLQSTGTAIDIGTGSPWVYIELFINKTAGTAIIRVSGLNECSASLPAGFNPTDCEVTIRGEGSWSGSSGNVSSRNHALDDIVHYIDSDPIGIVKVDGFFKDGNVLTGFTDGTDNGSTGTTGVNQTSFSNYRASSTASQEDRFSYSNILPAGVDANSIVAVIPSVIASSGSYVNGNLEVRFTSGDTTTTTDVTTLVQPYTPRYIQGPVYNQDPNTGEDWTRENVQAIQTGYRVKP